MYVKFKDGTKDVPVTEVTKENYIVPKGEEKVYHCIIEAKSFDSKTGRRISVPRIQKFGRKVFETSVARTLKMQGYDVVILHSPAEADAKEAEELEKRKAEAAFAAAAEAEEQKQAEIDRAVSDALAVQKAEFEKELAAQKAEFEKELAKTQGKTKK